MDNYGDASSWIMEYNFKPPMEPNTPIKVLMNGDLLFCGQGSLFIYSKNTEGYAKDAYLHQYSYYYFPCISTYTPSFSSLKTVGIHNVKSLCFHQRYFILSWIFVSLFHQELVFSFIYLLYYFFQIHIIRNIRYKGPALIVSTSGSYK